MKTVAGTVLLAVVLAPALFAQQFTPPALPPGTKSAGERAEAEVVKVYSADDQGAKYRAYAVKYKGAEVVVNDTLARSDHKVGDKISFMVSRVEMPSKIGNVNIMSFQIFSPPTMPKK